MTEGGLIAVAERAAAPFAAADLAPVVIGREVVGFAFDRLRGASPREASRLVRDGLGPRWSAVGPSETAGLV